MKKREISLSALARELNTEPRQIVAVCELEGVASPDWVEADRRSDTEWRGAIRLGLAETIRKWHREGRFAPRQTATERESSIVETAVAYAEKPGGEELRSILGSLQRQGIDLSSSRGRKLAWLSWKQFVAGGKDYDPYLQCSNCSESFRPTIDQRFVNTYIDQYLRPPSRWRVAERRLFVCPACRGEA